MINIQRINSELAILNEMREKKKRGGREGGGGRRTVRWHDGDEDARETKRNGLK